MYVTLEYAQTQHKLWLDAQTAVASGQSYTIGRRSLTRANLSDILRMIQYWEDEIDSLTSTSRPRTRRAVPRDL